MKTVNGRCEQVGPRHRKQCSAMFTDDAVSKYTNTRRPEMARRAPSDQNCTQFQRGYIGSQKDMSGQYGVVRSQETTEQQKECWKVGMAMNCQEIPSD